MNKQDLDLELEFKEKFLKLVEANPSFMGFYLKAKIVDFERNFFTERRFFTEKPPTDETAESIIEKLKLFSEKYPDFEILPADDPRNYLKGWVIYSVIEGKEIAKYLTISMKTYLNQKINIDKLIEDTFGVKFDQGNFRKQLDELFAGKV